jgi:hypothetical protein
MRRWGDAESHSYIIGAFSDLAKAFIEGIENKLFRGGKYEPFIEECFVDQNYVKEVSLTVALQYAKLKHPERFDDRGNLKEIE